MTLACRLAAFGIITGFFLKPTISLSESRTLIIAGGGNPLKNHRRYYDISKQVHELQRTRGQQVHVAATDGSWDFAEPGKIRPATNPMRINESLRNAAAGLKTGDTLVLFVNDHGHAPESLNQPGSSGLVLYSPSDKDKPLLLPHQHLKKMIATNVPPEVRVKLVGIHCFSGGMHEISFELPNVCSASNTDFRTTAKTKLKELNRYGEGFWRELSARRFDLNNDERTSLHEAHLAGFLQDDLNFGRADLSSSAYLDSILGEGAYNPNLQPQSNWDMILDLLMEIPSGPKKKFEYPLCDLREDQIDSEKITSLAGEISRIQSRMSQEMGWAHIRPGQLPMPLRNAYEWASKEWSGKKEVHRETLKRLQKEYADLRAEWMNLGWLERSIRNAAYTGRFDELEQRSKKELTSFLAVYRTMENLDKVARFMKKATQAQKEKFISLLQCEWEPL